MISTLIKQERDRSPVKIQEKAVRERLEKENLTEMERKLARLQIDITESVYKNLLRFFSFLRHNVNEKNPSKMYLTEASMKLNVRKYFGHKTHFLDERLYYVIADGQKNRRIYLDEFIQKFYMPLWEAPPIQKAKIMFRMLDFDNDGILHASDLVTAQEYFDELSDFGEEITKLGDYYVQVYLSNGGSFSFSELINLHKYKDLVANKDGSQSEAAKAELEKRKQKATTEEELAALEIEEFNKFRSCGIEEIKMKIMSKPEKYKDSSVFIANKEQIAKAK